MWLSHRPTLSLFHCLFDSSFPYSCQITNFLSFLLSLTDAVFNCILIRHSSFLSTDGRSRQWPVPWPKSMNANATKMASFTSCTPHRKSSVKLWEGLEMQVWKPLTSSSFLSILLLSSLCSLPPTMASTMFFFLLLLFFLSCSFFDTFSCLSSPYLSHYPELCPITYYLV